MPAPIVHVDVRGLDTPELARFYAQIFGWERDETRSYGPYSVTSLGTHEITAASGPVPDWKANEATFYIQVDDLDETIQRIEAAGGRAIMPKTVSPDDFPAKHIRVFTKFLDPAGNVVGLVETPIL